MMIKYLEATTPFFFILFASCFLVLTAQAKDELIILTYEDGETKRGKQLNDWHHGMDRWRLDSDKLLGHKARPQLLTQLIVDTTPNTSRIFLSNGDVLPARIVAYVAPDKSNNGQAAFQVSLAGAYRNNQNGHQIQIKASEVVGVIQTTQQVNLQDNSLQLRDGRIVPIKSLKWQSNQVKVLNTQGIQSFLLSEVLALQFSKPAQRNDALMLQARLAHLSKSRMQTVLGQHGLTLTAQVKQLRPTYTKYGRHRSAVHDMTPFWSLEPIRIPVPSIGTWAWYDPHQIPLSRLSAKAVEQSGVTGQLWHWQRDKNLHHGRLHTGNIISNLGISQHANSTIQFELPQGATHFSAWVGLDRNVDTGGCVKLKLYGDNLDRTLWASKTIIGSHQASQTGLIKLNGSRQLHLHVDMAHNNRPAGADPLDIRDESNWLLPMVHLDTKTLAFQADDFYMLMPPLKNWTTKNIQIHPRTLGSTTILTLVPDQKGINFTREITLPANVQNLELRASRTERDQQFYIKLLIDGKAMKDVYATDNYHAHESGKVTWDLKAYAGKRVKLTLAMTSKEKEPLKRRAGLVIRKITLR